MAETQPGGMDRKVAAQIRAVMGWRGVNQTELARWLDVQRPWLSRRLRGAVGFHLEDVARIASALGLTTVELTTVELPGPIDHNAP